MSYTYKQPGHRSGKSGKSHGSLKGFLRYAIPFLAVNSLIFYFATVSPEVMVKVGEEHDYLSASADIEIKSIWPTKNLKATMDSQDVPLTPNGRRRYTATVKKNGNLEIYVENFNGMPVTEIAQISSLDDNPPVVIGNREEDGILSLTLEDSQSGIDFDSIYATDSKGARQSPLSVDKTNSVVTFRFDKDGMTVSISDNVGHEAQYNTLLDGGGDGENMDEGGEEETTAASDAKNSKNR